MHHVYVIVVFFIISLCFVDLFIEFHRVLYILQATANSSADLSWLCSSHGGSDWRLCDECAMKIWTQNHLLESTAQIVACLKQNLCSVHEAGKPPVCAKQSWSFWIGWPFNGAHSQVEAWPSNQKKLQLCFAHTVWRWLPRLVDRAQVLPDKLRIGLRTPGGDFVLRFSSHTHRTIVSRTPIQEQIQLRPTGKCLPA